MQQMARIMAEVGRMANQAWMIEEATDLGYVKPQFKIVKFDTIEGGLVAKATGNYTASNIDAVQTDIEAAKGYGKFLERQYGIKSEVSFAMKNNILSITLALYCDMDNGRLYDTLANHLEELVWL